MTYNVLSGTLSLYTTTAGPDEGHTVQHVRDTVCSRTLFVSLMSGCVQCHCDVICCLALLTVLSSARAIHVLMFDTCSHCQVVFSVSTAQ